MPFIFVAVPSTGFWHATMANHLAGMAAFTDGVTFGSFSNEGSVITRSRNDCVKEALRLNADYLLQIDSDIVFPINAIKRFLAHDKEIVGATYNMRVEPYRTLGRMKLLAGETTQEQVQLRIARGGLHEAEELPGGFMFIKTDVFRRIPRPWYFETYYRDIDPVKAFRDMLRDHVQVTMPRDLEDMILATPGLRDWANAEQANVMKTGSEYISEDINFCRKAKRYGYRLWCDLDMTWELRHIGRQEISCNKPPELEQHAQAAE
jgi:hypothetical protein